jgi:hypothetical protein
VGFLVGILLFVVVIGLLDRTLPWPPARRKPAS